MAGVATRVIAASRTDAGVHALGQVISFRTAKSYQPKTWINAINYYLPEDIRVKEAYEVEETFNVMKDAKTREYKYYILNSRVASPIKSRFTNHVGYSLNIEEMNNACRLMLGIHDFKAFTNIKDLLINTRRTVHRAEFSKKSDIIIFNIEANSYLPYQIRNIVGSLIRVGLGKLTSIDFGDFIKDASPLQAGPVVPSKGLFLVKVNYDNFPPDSRRF